MINNINGRRAVYVLLTIASCFAIFILPLYFPTTRPSKSASYVYGFNNTVSVVSLVTCVFLFTLVGMRWGTSADGRLLPIFRHDQRGKGRIATWIVWSCIGITLLFISFVYFRKTKGLFYGEATYFVKRILFVVDGRRPYTDFEFLYGPALLYIPALLHAVLAPLGMTIKGSYFLFFSAATVAGLLMLAMVLNGIDIDRKQKTLLFVLLVFITMNHTMGAQYTLLRFVAPMACLLLIDFIRESFVPVDLSRQPRRQALLALVTIAGVGLCVLISPETGLVTFCAVCAYWGYLGITVSPIYLLTLALNFVGFVGVTAACGLGYFQSVASVARGGLNFPVIPAVSVLIYLYTILYAVPLAIGVALTGRGKPEAAALMAMAVLSMATIPGALGRCDFGHTFLYGIPASLLTFVFLLKRTRLAYKVFIVVFASMFLSMHAINIYLFSKMIIPYPLLVVIERLVAPAPLAHSATPPPVRLEPRRVTAQVEPISDLLGLGRIYLPFYCYDEKLFKYLRDNRIYDYDFYDGSESIFTPEQVARKLVGLKQANTILVPRHNLDGVDTFLTADEDPQFISRLFLFPFWLARKNASYLPDEEILKFVKMNFKRKFLYNNEYYLLMKDY